MTYQYDAFISYRHHAVDSAVAAEIQHRLEHFRIPRAIQKATGVRKISRIFRDKAELAITSDINPGCFIRTGLGAGSLNKRFVPNGYQQALLAGLL